MVETACQIDEFIQQFNLVFAISITKTIKARSWKPLKNKLIYFIDGRQGGGKENRQLFKAATFQDSSQPHC